MFSGAKSTRNSKIKQKPQQMSYLYSLHFYPTFLLNPGVIKKGCPNLEFSDQRTNETSAPRSDEDNLVTHNGHSVLIVTAQPIINSALSA